MRNRVILGVFSVILVLSLTLTPIAALPGIAYAGSPPAEAPIHLSPAGDAAGVLLTPEFWWEEVPGATEYALYISEPPYGSAHLVFNSEDYGAITETWFKLPPGFLEQGVTYAWNMRARNNAGWGPYSNSWFFTTATFGTITGQLTNVITGQGIFGYLGLVPDPMPEILYTGSQGHFKFDIPAGTYDIYGAAPAFEHDVKTDVTVYEGLITYLTFALTPWPPDAFTITTELNPPVLSPGDEGELVITVLPKTTWFWMTAENIVTLNPSPSGNIEVGLPHTEVLVPNVWWEYGSYQRWLKDYRGIGLALDIVSVMTLDPVGLFISTVGLFVDNYGHVFNRKYGGHAIPAHFAQTEVWSAVIYSHTCQIGGFRLTYPIKIREHAQEDLTLEMHVSACMETVALPPRKYVQVGRYHSITIPIAQGEKGSVSVTIEPQEAREAGARWRLTDGPDTGWKGSGAHVNDVPVGDYTIEYKDTHGWKTPSDESVTVFADTCALRWAHYVQQSLRFAPGDYVRTTASILNCRAEPEMSDNVIAQVPYSTLAQVKFHPDNGIGSDGHYWWYVELLADGRRGWLAETYLELVTTPYDFAPIHLAPPHRATNVFKNPIFKWNEVPGATKYGLYISKPPYGPENLVFDSQVDYGPITGTTFALPFELEAGVTYYWNMRAGTADRWGPFSTSWCFTTGDHTLVPVDLVLVLDKSWSMEWYKVGPTTRLQAAKDAAVSVIDMLTPHDRVAVISFAGSATIDVQLTNNFENAKTRIQQIRPASATSFGAGMKSALEELEQRGAEDHAWAIVFLSDGEHFSAPHPKPYVEKCVGLGIPIYAVGLANTPAEVDEELLHWMAEETGGKYFFVDELYDLQNVFLAFTLEATGWPFSADFTGTVGQGETVVAGDFVVEPGTDHVRITLNWPGSDLDLAVIRPDGSEVGLGEDSDNIYSGAWAKPEWVILLDPEPGVWTVKVWGKVINPHSQYIVWVSTYVAPTGPTIPSTYKFEYSVPDPIMVATDVNVDVTFMTDEEGDIGYDGVRFKFEADGPGDVSFRATDSEGVEHTFMNSGYWGPETGFDLPASYNASTMWTLNFLEKAGNYTITFSLVEAPDGDVIADITETVTVTVKPLPAEVTIDPETLNLQAPAKWITAYIELPEDYDYAAEGIDINTVRLLYSGNELYADWGDVQDGVFMAKFDWVTVAGWFDGLHDVGVELTVAGEVDGVEFEGTATIRVIDPPRPPRRGR